MLHYILIYFHSVDDTRVHTFLYKCVKTGAIHWLEMGWEYNVVNHYVYYNFYYFYGLMDLQMVLNLEYITLR